MLIQTSFEASIGTSAKKSAFAKARRDKAETRIQKLEDRNQELEARSQKGKKWDSWNSSLR